LYASIFERLVVELLVAMGYGGSFLGRRTGCRAKAVIIGIDGIIKKPGLGWMLCTFKQKRWEERSVGPSYRHSLAEGRAAQIKVF